VIKDKVYMSYSKFAQSINNPSPRQLFNLAGVCFGLGREEQNRLHRYEHIGADVFNTDFYSESRDYFDYAFENVLDRSQKFIGKIALSSAECLMNIREINWYFIDGDLVEQFDIRNQFVWSRDEVRRAQRIITVGFHEIGKFEGYQIPSLDSSLFNADFVAATRQMEIVSAGDCSLLIEEIQAFQELQSLQT
jgi:hypothetical protein